MKPTSMIFLVLSLILAFGGFMTCSFAKTMAASDGIAIYDQTFDDNGDAVYRYEIDDNVINKLSLTFSDVDVTVVGNASSSYVELKNFDVTGYAVSLTGGNVSVDGTVGLLSSLIDMSNGGLRFRGLRYFLLDKPDPSRERSVTVYISNACEMRALSVSLKNGTVSFQNMDRPLDYSVTLSEANAVFDHVTSTSVAQISAANGDVTVNESKFATVSASMEKGNFIVNGSQSMSYQFTGYDLKINETGSILFNGADAGQQYKVTAPIQEMLYMVTVSGGNIQITDGGSPAESIDPVDPATESIQ
ncbi:MAG: DUF4097 family beta strand repeat protein [Clostridia bacterium]|nr:DUF4097 family beta strand repeat protein [Clostridia bacterium]